MKSVVNCGPNKINQKHCQHLDCTRLIVATYCVRVPLIILFEKQNTLFSVETFITAYHLRGCSIPDSLNLEKNSGENNNFALILDFPAQIVLGHACPYPLEQAWLQFIF